MPAMKATSRSAMRVMTPRFAALLLGAASPPALLVQAHAQPLPAEAPAGPPTQPAPVAAPSPPAPADTPPPGQSAPVSAPSQPAPTDTPSAPPAQAAPSAAPTQAAPAHPAPAQLEPTDRSVVGDDAEEEDVALLLSDDDEPRSEAPALTFFGFADFTFSKHLTPFAFGSPYESFGIGNFNLYMSSELSSQWRTLAEVRYMYLPNGAPVFGTNTITRIDTNVVDYTDFGRNTRWGGISLERAWIEYSAHQLLTVRLGSFLTPYGIWNVDHGSPVIIGVHRPWIVGEGLIPIRQTGIEAYGAVYLGAMHLGYHVTLSNGRGPIDSYQDFNHNKALGGRIFLRNDSPVGLITVGVSAYFGKYSARRDEPGVEADGSFVIRQPLTLEYDELSLGADVKWEWGDLLIQSEASMNEVAYNEQVRPVDAALAGGPPGFAPDSRRHGAYALGAYRTPFFNVMPFFGGEYYDVGAYPGLFNSRAFFGGLNVRVIPSVVLKAQYTHARFVDGRPGTPKDRVNLIDLQTAWSF